MCDASIAKSTPQKLMKTIKQSQDGERMSTIASKRSLLALLAMIILLTGQHARAGGTVTSCTEANLRAALAGGGTVTFACNGTITLANTISITDNTTLDGSGCQVAISGGNAVGVFYVNNNVNLALMNLSVANGKSSNGGALCLQSGTVSATDCIFTNNQATANSAQGGAIFNAGVLVIDNCGFTQNEALGGYAPGPMAASITAWGGAIYNSGSLVINRSSLTNNLAVGAAGVNEYAPSRSGAGNAGGLGASACGSAIYNSGSLILQNSTVAFNTATGGPGGLGQEGGQTLNGYGQPGGNGGDGGDGWGAIFNVGTASLVNCTVAFNRASGGGGGPAGQGGETWEISPTNQPGGAGGAGGNGGSGFGIVFDNSGLLRMTNCTVASNTATAGSGGAGGLGGAGTPPNYPLGPTGANGSGGYAISAVSSGIFANTLLAGNVPGNAFVTSDGGHNLSSDASCALTGLGSMTNIDPQLGPLANDGGPTLTMAPLPGSPAIDAGSAVGAPATDQRGVPRPQGRAVDIGAYEYLSAPLFIGMTIQSSTNCCLQMAGLAPDQTFILQVSSNLVNWSTVANFTGTNGFVQYTNPAGQDRNRFYRLKSGTE
jgi:hypothetical protein